MYTYKSFNTPKVERSDNDYCYFAVPAGVRVNKHTGEISKLRRDNGVTAYFKAAMCKTGKSVSSQFRIYANGTSYSCARLIAIACYGYPLDEANSFALIKDGDQSNLVPSNIEWGTHQTAVRKRFKGFQWTEEEEQILNAIPRPHNRHNAEYQRFLNRRKGPDGLTKTQRFVRSKLSKAEDAANASKPIDVEL